MDPALIHAAAATAPPSAASYSLLRTAPSHYHQTPGAGGGATPTDVRMHATAQFLDQDKKLYEWEVVLSDPVLAAALAKQYAKRMKTTRRCDFPWAVRNLLGDFLCPSHLATQNIIEKAKQRGQQIELMMLLRDQIARQTTDEATTVLLNWTEQLNTDDKLLCGFKELYMKMEKEKEIMTTWDQERRLQAINARLPKAAGAGASATFVPLETRDMSRALDDTVKIVRSLETAKADLDSEHTKLEELSASIRSVGDNDRHYHTLSLVLFAKALIWVWVAMIPVAVLDIDPVAIVVTACPVLLIGVWGYSLGMPYILPNYRGLDLYFMLSIVITFFYLAYAILRSTIYNWFTQSGMFDGVVLFLIWVEFGFMAGCCLFSLRLFTIKQMVIEAQYRRLTQEQQLQQPPPKPTATLASDEQQSSPMSLFESTSYSLHSAKNN